MNRAYLCDAENGVASKKPSNLTYEEELCLRLEEEARSANIFSSLNFFYIFPRTRHPVFLKSFAPNLKIARSWFVVKSVIDEFLDPDLYLEARIQVLFKIGEQMLKRTLLYWNYFFKLVPFGILLINCSFQAVIFLTI